MGQRIMNPYVLIGGSILLLISVLASKISDRLGVPTLLLFLLLGMLAGSEGIGGIYFDDPAIAQAVGMVALVLIMFAGGLDTEWEEVRSVAKESLLLATVGVFIAALITGLFATFILDLPLVKGLLLGSIVSSTDAAAVFSVLRSKGVSLKGRLKPLLELESGSNDPIAVCLTVGLIQLIVQSDTSPVHLIAFFVQQMLIGAAVGYGMGRMGLYLINHIKLGYEGLYPVLTLGLAFLIFGLTDALRGSGFLAVYVAGIVLRHYDLVHKRSLLRFHDGLSWLMHIAMFLTLGLFVFPSRLIPIMGVSLLITGVLMFVARPATVLMVTLGSPLNWREKAFVSWVGLRGAVPIILATFPLLAGIPEADLIFNVIFFIVLTSVLLQGTSIPPVARWLGVDAPLVPKRAYPIEYVPMDGLKSELKELPIPPGSHMAGKAIVELRLPADLLVVLIARDNEFLVPNGGTILEGGDILLVLSDEASYNAVLARSAPRDQAAA